MLEKVSPTIECAAFNPLDPNGQAITTSVVDKTANFTDLFCKHILPCVVADAQAGVVVLRQIQSQLTKYFGHLDVFTADQRIINCGAKAQTYVRILLSIADKEIRPIKFVCMFHCCY